MTGGRGPLLLLSLLAGFLIFAHLRSSKNRTPSFAYPAPRIPAHRFKNLDDDHLMKLARVAARQTRSETRLGLIREGTKTLILILPQQDMRVADAIKAALRERHVDADFITEDRIFDEAFGTPEEANLGGLGRTGVLLNRDGGVVDGVLEAYLWGWPNFLPEEKQRQGPRRGSNELREVQAAKVYLDKHPEYQSYFGRSSLVYREYAEQVIGKKYVNNWHYTFLYDLINQTTPFPDEIARLVEDRVVEVLPWAEDIHVTEPEGTDLRFSLNEDEAGLWYKGAYEPPQIEVNPFAGTIGLNWRETNGRFVVPNFNGVIAGHAGHAGYYPLLKVFVENGQARRVEGGGELGELWQLYLENPKLREAHYPGTPAPGFLYLYQGELGIDPKKVTMGRPLAGRSGMIYWGFGLDAVTPDMEAYARKNDLPIQHGLHVHTFFPTYEIKLRDESRRVKLTDRGHLTALDDPEVQALASRYGKALEVLSEEFIPELPGINAPGNYEQDYAHDPLSYEKAFWKRVLGNR